MPPTAPADGAATIALLHGVNNTADVWDPVRARLKPWQSIAPELPGVDDIDEIARAVAPRDRGAVVLVGHSFGGYVALSLLATVPDRIAGLILVNSSDRADSAEARRRREASVARARAGEYAELGGSATAASYHPDSLADAALMAQRERSLAAYGPERFIAHQIAAAARPDRRDLLAASPVPVLVVAGADDRVVPAPRQREMAESVGAEFVVIERAGHMLPAERPEPLAGAIAEWLRGVRPPRAATGATTSALPSTPTE